MSAILIISIALRLAATGWALYLLVRVRDWRIGFLAAMIALMATRQILTLSGQHLELPISFSGNWDEIPGLGVSILAFLSLFFVGELIRDHRDRADTLSALSGTQRVILDNAQIGIVLVKGRRIVWANPHFTTMLGWEPRDYEGKDSRFLYPDNTAYKEMAALGTPLLKAGKVIDQELQVAGKNGALIWARMIGRAVNPSDRSQGTIWLIEDISQRKRQAEERAALTDRLKHSQTIARLASWEYEPKTDKLLWSEEAYQMLGIALSDHEPSIEFEIEMTHPDDRATVVEGFQKTLEDGSPYEAIRRIICPNGTELVVHEYSEIGFDADGNVDRIYGVTQDITESARAENELRENEAHLRSLLGNSTAAIASTDTSGCFTFWNKAYEELTGYNGEDLKTVTSREVTHPDDLDDVRAVFDQIKRGEIDQYRRERRILRKDGTVVWGDLSASAVRNADGTLTEVIGVVADITEKKHAEEALRESEAQLKYSQKIAGLANWHYDPRTDTHVWSDEIYSALGLRPEDIELNMTTMLALSHPDDRDAVREALETVLTGGADAYSVVHRVTRSDGTELVVHDHGIPIRDKDGDLVGIDGVTQDITDLSFAEKALREREALLSMVLEHSFDGILTLKPIRDTAGKIIDFEYTSFSKSAIKALGIDLTGRRVLDAFPSSPEDGMFRQYVEAVETGQTALTERHYSGELPGDPWFRIVTTPTNDGLTVAFNNITEKKRAEEALKQSEAQHRGILASSSAAIASNGADGKFLYWNTAFEQFIGYSADELAGMTLDEITHPDEGSKASEDFQSLRSGVIDGFRREKKYRQREGAAVWGDVSVSVIRDANGNLIQTIAVIADVTEKKRAEAALMDREALLSSVLERSFDGMVTLKALRDERGQIEDFEYTGTSGTAVQTLGQDPVGKRFMDLFPTSRETGQFSHYVDVVETGQAADIEAQYKGVLPGDPWLRLVAAPVGNGFAIAFSDVTDIKNAEKALLDRKAVLTSVLERSFGGMVTMIAIRDEDGQIVDFEYTSASGKAAQMMGQNPVGKRLFGIFPAARESGQFDRYKGVIETGQAVDVETQYKGLLPGDPWLRMVAAPMEGGVAIAFTDITEIKNAEKALREQAAIIAQIHESIISTDLDGTITGWNDGAEKLFGCGREEAIGLHYSTFYAEENTDALKAQIENPTVKNGRHELEIELRRKSGEVFTGHVLFSVLLNDAGNPSGMVGYTIDITERKAAEEALKTAYAEMEMRVENRTQDLKTELVRGQRTQKQLEQAKELAEQASRAKSEFLSRVSHELRTPMNAILGFGQLLQYDKKSSLTGDQPQYVNEIMSAGDHLLMLISQLLDMSKIETGNMELSLAPLASGPLIEECVAMTLAQAKERGISVHNNGTDLDLPPVLADPLRFKQVLLNLLSNAVKYNRDNGEIVIDCRETDAGLLRLTVTDQGQGIAPDKYECVFEPFNRAGAENADIPGTGIGLAIAKQMVELMGGEIGLESTVGTGSSFWFTIPLAREPVETLSL